MTDGQRLGLVLVLAPVAIVLSAIVCVGIAARIRDAWFSKRR